MSKRSRELKRVMLATEGIRAITQQIKVAAPEAQLAVIAEDDARLAREAWARATAWAKAPAGTKYGEVEQRGEQ